MDIEIHKWALLRMLHSTHKFKTVYGNKRVYSIKEATEYDAMIIYRRLLLSGKTPDEISNLPTEEILKFIDNQPENI